MGTLRVFDQNGTLGGTVEVDDRVFGAEGGDHLIHEAVTTHLASRRQGTHKTRERADVSGGGRKPWRQKGTGRARVGTIRSPLWWGGGTTFGPRPRDYSRKLPTTMGRKARIAALSAKFRDQAVFAMEPLRPSEPKTREVHKRLKAMELHERTVLLLVSESDRNLVLAARNLPGCRTLLATNVSVYDIINSDVVVIEKDAIGPLQEQLTR